MKAKEDLSLICTCHNFDHMLYFWEWDDNGYKELYVEVHLSTHRNFFKRLWYGLKYAFGYKSRFGAWDEFIFNKESKKKLKKYINSK